MFLEPYLQQHGTVQVVSSPSTPPPNPLQHHQLTQLHHVQVSKSLERRIDSNTFRNQGIPSQLAARVLATRRTSSFNPFNPERRCASVCISN